MDIFSTVATAVALALKLKQYAQDVASASNDIKRLRYKVVALSDVLTQIGQASAPSEPVPLSLTGPFEASLKRCDTSLKILESQLRPTPSAGQGKGKRGVGKALQHARQRLEWPFKSAEVEKAVSELHDYLVTFNAAIGLDGRAITVGVKQTVEHIDQRAERDLLRKNLDPLVEAKLGSDAVG